MGTLMWFAKMLLKILKPFAKIALTQALYEAIKQYVSEEETTVDDPTEPEAIDPVE